MEVDLVTLESKTIVIGDSSDYVAYFEPNQPINRIRNSNEFIPHGFVDVEYCTVERVIDQGVCHYIAVTRKVWEYLYLIKNPVTAESQQAEIERQRDDLCKARITIEMDRIKIDVRLAELRK